MQRKIEHLPVKDVKADEIWGFVAKKESHKMPGEESHSEIDDAYCFVAMERTTKLILAFHLGKLNAMEAFIGKLRYATSDARYQLSTDGFQPYAQAVNLALSDRVDYAQLTKVYRSPREGEQRYSPGEVINTEAVPVMGNSSFSRMCTSYIERQNLSIRMGMRRMTRLSNALSKKWENLQAACALWFAFYIFCKPHGSLRVTPAMQQGIAGHVWSIKELIG